VVVRQAAAPHPLPLQQWPLLIDIWTTRLPPAGEDDALQKPVLLFLHGGGGGLGGFKRMQSSVGLLHDLAARSWLVVSMGYRKQCPLHVEDAFAAFTWCCAGGRCVSMAVCGEQTGGGVFSFVAVCREGSSRHCSSPPAAAHLIPVLGWCSSCSICSPGCCSCKHGEGFSGDDSHSDGGRCTDDGAVPEAPAVRGVVLFHPAVDVRQSTLSWFFEKVVMRGRFGAVRENSSLAWEASWRPLCSAEET